MINYNYANYYYYYYLYGAKSVLSCSHMYASED